MTTKQTIQDMINCNATMVFYYKYSHPETKRIVQPINIKGKTIHNPLVECIDQEGNQITFKLDGIIFPETVEQRLAREINEMYANDIPEIPKTIIRRQHFWDCGYGFEGTDSCECGKRGWTRVLYDDGTRDVLPNM